MTCIIVDDEPAIRKGLEIMLKKNCPFIRVVGQADCCTKAIELVQQLKPDLVFLDIEMPDGTGFDFLLQLDEIDFEIIFVTGFDQYAIQAFKFSAVDYLLKPVDELDLVKAISKAQHNIKFRSPVHTNTLLHNIQHPNSQSNNIAISKIDGYEFIAVQEIIRCEADKETTKIFLSGNETIYSTKGLGELYALLENYDFSRVHQSHIINLHKVKRYFKGEGGYVKMTDGTSVDVSRRRKKEFLQKLKACNML